MANMTLNQMVSAVNSKVASRVARDLKNEFGTKSMHDIRDKDFVKQVHAKVSDGKLVFTVDFKVLDPIKHVVTPDGVDDKHFTKNVKANYVENFYNKLDLNVLNKMCDGIKHLVNKPLAEAVKVYPAEQRADRRTKEEPATWNNLFNVQFTDGLHKLNVYQFAAALIIANHMHIEEDLVDHGEQLDYQSGWTINEKVTYYWLFDKNGNAVCDPFDKRPIAIHVHKFDDLAYVNSKDQGITPFFALEDALGIKNKDLLEGKTIKLNIAYPERINNVLDGDDMVASIHKPAVMKLINLATN